MKELNLTPIEDFITEDFGAEGTPTRMEFDADVDAFILGERLKEERQKAGLTQDGLSPDIRECSHTLVSHFHRFIQGNFSLLTLAKPWLNLGYTLGRVCEIQEHSRVGSAVHSQYSLI